MDARCWIAIFCTVSLCSFSTAWLYPCKRYGFGSYTIMKQCTLEKVFINQETALYRVFFPPVDLAIYSGYIPSFNEAVAERLSNKTKRLSIMFCGVEDVFLKDTLKSVDLRFNLLSKVQFRSAKALQIWTLHLDYNLLRDASFVQNMEALVILTLSNNIISTLSWNTFRRLRKLVTLNIGGNLIKSIDSEADFKLPALKRLELAENRMEYFELSRLNFQAVRELNVSSNQLLSVNMFHFGRTFPALESVDINHNPWNCGRKHRLEDRMDLKGIRNEKSQIPPRISCHENKLETVALTTPEEVDEITHNFRQLEYVYADQLSGNEAKQRLAMAEERISYLMYDLNATDVAVQKLKQKASHLFQLYNLRTTSRNFNMPS
ncbi:uncharacterized protein LOC129767775 [Toxorhynchites rutilus septentrionalis]|uniref:uncharacterized protein LOC129767775 n=1 Tax=Toxorhynchites rutilus septentrionalis TaxID=329112 RepID=UPI002479BD5E|nr:uncharacterized protein LOC129767775 [Toxorhynchites rutilus septentrionalis]